VGNVAAHSFDAASVPPFADTFTVSDVRATAHVLRTIAAKAPLTWQLMSRLANKASVIGLLLESEFVLVAEHFGAPFVRPVVPICSNPDYPAEWLGIDISADPGLIVGLSPEGLAATFAQQKRLLCRIRSNAMPLIAPAGHPGATKLLAANVAPDVLARTRTLRGAAGFPDRLVAAAALGKREYPKATFVEDQLYEGGFFPTRADQALIGSFHANTTDPASKLALLDAMQDGRARQLGKRIVFNEWPEVLDTDARATMERERVARLNSGDGPWTSIAKALAEINKLLPTAAPPTVTILEGYRNYLNSLAVSHAA
jgi:exonuclease I